MQFLHYLIIAIGISLSFSGFSGGGGGGYKSGGGYKRGGGYKSGGGGYKRGGRGGRGGGGFLKGVPGYKGSGSKSGSSKGRGGKGGSGKGSGKSRRSKAKKGTWPIAFKMKFDLNSRKRAVNFVCEQYYEDSDYNYEVVLRAAKRPPKGPRSQRYVCGRNAIGFDLNDIENPPSSWLKTFHFHMKKKGKSYSPRLTCENVVGSRKRTAVIVLRMPDGEGYFDKMHYNCGHYRSRVKLRSY